MTSSTGETRVLDVDERAELERLRAEVARLREQAAAGPPTSRSGVARGTRSARGYGRTLVAVLLIGVACALAPLSVVSVWARSEVTDPDRYVETVAPLAHDPAVQKAITNNLTNIVFQYVDVQGITNAAVDALQGRDLLPPAVANQLHALAVPLANGVQSFTQDRITQVVQSDAFAQAWEQANRSAHEQLVNALTGQGGAVTVENNAVKVNLAAFLDVVKQRLVANGFELAARIPEVNATFTVFESSDIQKVQRGFAVLDTLGYWLPFILVAIAAVGIYAARNHRLAFIGAGIGVTVAMLVTAIALQVVRSVYLDGVPANVLPPDAAAVLFDTVVRFLREAVRALALVGVLVALGAFLTGPSTTATTVRRWCLTALAAAKGEVVQLGLTMTSVTTWVAPKAALLRGIIVAAALGVLLLERYRTPILVLWLTAGVLAALAVVAFLAVEPRKRAPAESRVVTQASEGA
jgi:hypothetical protein